MKRILVVGAIPDEKNRAQYGGATVLMKNFLDYLDQENANYKFARTNRFTNKKTGEKRPLLNKLYFLLNFFFRIWTCRLVMFNFSDAGVVSVFPFLCRISKSLGKKVVLRKFGGSFEIYLKGVSFQKVEKARKALAHCDLILIETRAGIQHIKRFVGKDVNIEWFPNNRIIANDGSQSSKYSNRLVFMSHVNDEKGIREILSVAEMLPDYRFDIYGAIKEPKYQNYDFRRHGVNYCGEISSVDVIKTLPSYSALLLPSSYRDGYPGIIIEAIGCGVPVITTTVGGIPEMITDGVEGRLIEPHDSTALKNAILSIDEPIHKVMSKNAKETFKRNFDSATVNPRILSKIGELL